MTQWSQLGPARELRNWRSKRLILSLGNAPRFHKEVSLLEASLNFKQKTT